MKQNQPISKRPQRKKTDPVVIPENFLTETFLDAWDELMKVRKELKRGKDSDYAQGLLIDKIVELSENNLHKAIEIIQQSIIRRWVSVFPLQKMEGAKVTQTSYSLYREVKELSGGTGVNPSQFAPKENFTPAQADEMQKNSYDELDKYIQINKKLPITWPYVNVFYHLERTGQIKDSVDEKQIFLNKVIEKLKGELARLKERSSSAYPIWEKILAHPESIKNEARKERTIKFFKEKYNLADNV